MTDNSLVARAQEIIAGNEKKIPGIDALAQAILERYGNKPEVLAKLAAGGMSQAMKALRYACYDIPDHGDEGQLRLFDIPLAIVINDPDSGPVFINRAEATLGNVRQFARERDRYTAIQRLRSTRATKELALIDDLDDDVSWVMTALAVLEERKIAALEGPDA